MEALEKLKIMSTLTSGIVHDINNVLTTIIGYTDILLTNDSCGDCKAQIEIIKKIAMDGAEIARRVKEFAKTNEDTRKVFNICETIQTSIMITKPLWFNQAQMQGKKIAVNYNSELPVFIYGNESEIREALVNMIFNSVDAIQKEGFIQVEIQRDRNQAVIRIMDNGIGMTEEIKNKIFTPFFTTKKENGSGLGLSTAYKTITDIGGKIEVESTSGSGTEFKIVLPIAKEEIDKKSDTKIDFSKLDVNILIIDDQIEICSVVKEMLAKIIKGKIETCIKGKEALNLLKTNIYDIVFTDIAMPDINGLELIKYIRTERPDTKVIAMTGWNGYIEKDNTDKPDYILSKPFTIEDLEMGIGTIYENRSNLVV